MDFLIIVEQPDKRHRLFYPFHEPGGWDFKAEAAVREVAQREFANVDECRIHVLEMTFHTDFPRLIYRTQNT
jgi:hypothetical protein